jgi:hypothetical protein
MPFSDILARGGCISETTACQFLSGQQLFHILKGKLIIYSTLLPPLKSQDYAQTGFQFPSQTVK